MACIRAVHAVHGLGGVRQHMTDMHVAHTRVHVCKCLWPWRLGKAYITPERAVLICSSPATLFSQAIPYRGREIGAMVTLACNHGMAAEASCGLGMCHYSQASAAACQVP